MKKWFKALMALLAGGDQTRTPRRTDWRGRPVDENTGGPIPPVSLPDAKLHVTLHLPSSAEAPGAALGGPPSQG
jgi:hypothetical protein